MDEESASVGDVGGRQALRRFTVGPNQLWPAPRRGKSWGLLGARAAPLSVRPHQLPLPTQCVPISTQERAALSVEFSQHVVVVVGSSPSTASNTICRTRLLLAVCGESAEMILTSAILRRAAQPSPAQQTGRRGMRTPTTKDTNTTLSLPPLRSFLEEESHGLLPKGALVSPHFQIRPPVPTPRCSKPPENDY